MYRNEFDQNVSISTPYRGLSGPPRKSLQKVSGTGWEVASVFGLSGRRRCPRRFRESFGILGLEGLRDPCKERADRCYLGVDGRFSGVNRRQCRSAAKKAREFTLNNHIAKFSARIDVNIMYVVIGLH